MDGGTVRTLAVIALAGWLGVAAGCESAEDRCEAARGDADRAWGAYVDVATPEARAAADARDEARDAVARALMDLGNLRTEGSDGAEGVRHDAFVGIEVSVGAVVGAVLAVGRLFEQDIEAAEEIAAAVTEELEGRYAELMTAPLETDEELQRVHDLGDACSTRLQLMVREQPEAVRARVLESFEALSAAEGEPDDGMTIELVRRKWEAFLEAARAAREAQDRVDAAVDAREAAGGPTVEARAAAQAVPADDAPERAAAAEAADRAFTACAEAGP